MAAHTNQVYIEANYKYATDVGVDHTDQITFYMCAGISKLPSSISTIELGPEKVQIPGRGKQIVHL